MENVPAGYVALDLVGFTDRGPYVDDATYIKNDLVHLKNMIWKCKVDNTTRITPANNANWEVFIQSSTDMAGITAIDTSGVIGTAGQAVVSQDLIDAIADRVMTKLLLKSDLTSQIVNDNNKAASIAALFSVNEVLKQTNSNFELNIGVNKNIILKNNINGYAYIEDKDIHRNSVVIANSQGSIDNTQVHSVIVAGDGLAVVWFSSFNENEYGVNYRVLN